MLARRVIAISPDKAIAKRISAGLMASGGTVESVPSPDALARGEIQAALVVLHLDGDSLDPLKEVGERIRKDGWIIVVLPKSDLKQTVAAMQLSSRIAGIFVADDLTVSNLAAMCTRVMHGDIFGLEKLVPWGTRVYSTLVGDYQEKSICISQISEYAASMGVRRKYREAIEQCSDELLMNALYDAPVDSAGNQLFADVPTKTRISLRMEQKAVVQYSCDSRLFTLSVRDSFGTLERDTVLKYLHKCLYADQQIDRKAGGAGLGLYIMCNATTQFFINALPGVATEVVCTFDLTAPKVMLKEFGFFNEKIDASGRLVAGRSQLAPGADRPPGFPVERRERQAASRGVIAGLSGALVLLLALIGLVAYQQFGPAAVADVSIHTDPPDAVIEIDGKTYTANDGRVVVKGLRAGDSYQLTATADGWTRANLSIIPSKDRTKVFNVKLQPKAKPVVMIDSDPPGAMVTYNGTELGKTPLSTDTLPPGEQIDLVFSKVGYREVTRGLRVPKAGGEASMSAAMSMSPDFGSVQITSIPEGALVYQNGELLAGVKTPVDEHIVQAGRRYDFTLKAPGYMPAHVPAQVSPGDRAVPIAAELKPGGSVTVTGNIDGRATVEGVRPCTRVDLPLQNCALPNGKYTVRVEANRPWASVSFDIVIKNNEVRKDLKFGIVEASDGWEIQYRRGRTAKKVALEEGTQKVTVVNADSGESKSVSVRVNSGRPTTVP